MTPTELKDLSEWSAEFLKLKFIEATNEYEIYINGKLATIPRCPNYIYLPKEKPEIFFDPGMYIAPILMHLAQVEMEKECWEFQHETYWQPGDPKWIEGPTIHKINYYRVEDGPKTPSENKNKFIAFWLAVSDAVKGETK